MPCWTHVRRRRLAVLATALIVAGAAGCPRPLAAQSDSTTSALRLAVAAGPTLAAPSGGGSRWGYVVQGSVAVVRPTSPWRLRGDVLYQHAGTTGGHMRSNGDGGYRMRGEVESSAAAFASAVLAKPRAKAVAPYLLAGLGIGWTDAMSGSDGLESSRSVAGLAGQGGVGIEWPRGRRALSLEARWQVMRSPFRGQWLTTVPVTVGVSF